MFRIVDASAFDAEETKKRVDWPFKRMKVGEVLEFSSSVNHVEARNAARNYGKRSGMEFAFKNINDTLLVKRTK